jgi:hypothetical protein
VQPQRLAKPFAYRLERLQQLHPQLVLADYAAALTGLRPRTPGKFGYRRR